VTKTVLLAAATVLGAFHAERRPATPGFDAVDGWTAPSRPSVSLALSGGGAWGLAHIGVLEALFEDGVEIDGVAGTSIGALVGGLLCAGYDPAEIGDVVRSKNWDELVSGLDVRRRVLSRREELYRNAQLSFSLRRGRRLQVGALTESRALERELYRYLLRAQLESMGDFDALRYPFRPVATDVLTGRRVAPAGGSLIAAVGGSIAVPGVFRPVPFGEALLVDGGLVENIPVETARTFGNDVVIASDLSARVDPSDDLGGAADLLGRSITIMSLRRDEELRDQADVAISPDVETLPRASFGGAVDELIAKGRAAYHEQRELVWKALEDALPQGRTVDFDRVEVTGSDRVDAAELSARLGGVPGRVTAFRVEAELARLLNREPLRDGRVDWLELDDGSHALRFVLEESAPVERVSVTSPLPGGLRRPILLADDRYSPVLAREVVWQARSQLIEAGHVLARLERFDWLPDAERIDLALADQPVSRIDTEVEGRVRLERTRAAFRDLVGPRFNFERLMDRLQELEARGAVQDWWLRPTRTPDGVELQVRLRGDDHLELGASGTLRGQLGFAGFLRAAKSNLTGRGDFVDLVIEGGHDTLGIEGRYRAEYGVGQRNLGAEVGLRYFDNTFLAVDAADQDLVDDLDERYAGERGWLALIRRMRVGGVGRLGLFRETLRFEETATEPYERVTRTSVLLGFELNRHEKLLFPERGFAFEIEAEQSVSQVSLWRARSALDAVVPLDADRAHVLTLRVGAGMSEGADRRPLWFDPGGHRELYGFIPYGAAAPQFVHGGLVWRYRWFDFSLARVYVEAGVDWIGTALERDALGDQGTWGYGASIVGNARFLGPIAIGAARNDAGAGTVFVTVGFPFPGH